MTQKLTARSPEQNDRSIQQPGKIVVSSVVTHASLLAAISDRNPIIGRRTTADEDKS